MGDQSGLAELVAGMERVSANLTLGDARTDERFGAIEKSLDELFRKFGRPGMSDGGFGDEALERKEAHDWCVIRKQLQVPKDDGLQPDYNPSSDEIGSATIATRVFSKLWRHADFSKLDHTEQKSLSAFSLGNVGWLLPPERASRAISCIHEHTNLAGLVEQATISAGSLIIPIDNARAGIDDSAWACMASCFANNPNQHLGDGLGQLEIKAEELRHVVCATPDLLQDSSFPIESWIFDKVSAGFRTLISNAILLGDGIGKPLGVLNPRAGIPICETAISTAAGSLTWMDLVALAFEVPVEWHPNSAFYMNQRVLGQILTMSDASGRPVILPTPVTDGAAPGARFSIAGFPIRIVTQMPDIQPGATPVLFGSLKDAYLMVIRRGVTMTTDPYSAGFCVLYKFSARIGGAPTCPNAMRLLRIR